MRGSKPLVALFVLAGLLSFGNAHAASHISGNIKGWYLNAAGPETAQFVSGGCAVNTTDAVAQATINLKPYVGKLVKVSITPAGTDALNKRSATVAVFKSCGTEWFGQGGWASTNRVLTNKTYSFTVTSQMKAMVIQVGDPSVVNQPFGVDITP